MDLNVGESNPLSYKEESPATSVSPNGGKRTILSTSSPEGIQVASQITPTRLANLLLKKGPLPIRYITSQLATDVPGFKLLSLSKQRRLIMAAMEQVDPENNVVFEKIGWGQWAVRPVDSDYIVSEGVEGTENGDKKQINVHKIRNQANVKLGWSKKAKAAENTKNDPRRESITSNRPNLHNLKLPNEKLGASTTAVELDSESDYALSDIDDDNDDDEEEEDDDDEGQNNDYSAMNESDDELFEFDHDDTRSRLNKHLRSPPIKFADRVPLKLSPPPANKMGRRKSSSSNPASISKNSVPHRMLLNRSRLNSLENLDNYILSSAKTSSGSVTSPPPPAGMSTLPFGSWNSMYMNNGASSNEPIPGIAQAMSAVGRRKSSFNESHIRSTLSSSLPRHSSHLPLSGYNSPPTRNVVSNSNPHLPERNHDDGYMPNSKTSNSASDTDEEDWATIGAESLRKRSDEKSQNNGNSSGNKEQKEEQAAANALVDLMSV